MNSQYYNLIMHADDRFFESNVEYVDFPISRFLERTDAAVRDKFQLSNRSIIGQESIELIKQCLTIFAVEDEDIESRIGKILDIKIRGSTMLIKHKFLDEYYPLKRGTLRKHGLLLNISNRGFGLGRTYWAIKEVDLQSFYQNEYLPGFLSTLSGIAHGIEKDKVQKTHLVYGFNGSGKTSLSTEFLQLPSIRYSPDLASGIAINILYYNSYTEDSFYWQRIDRSSTDDAQARSDETIDLIDGNHLDIQSYDHTEWLLSEQGKEGELISNFRRYTNTNLTPKFHNNYSTVTFSYNGDFRPRDNIKISKGEESCFVWCFFFTLLERVIDVLDEPNPDLRETNQFDQLQYVFIDDPVTSLDEEHLIELAVNISQLIDKAPKELKFIITTHNPLFYNVIYNQCKLKSGYLLEKQQDNTFSLSERFGDSNQSFSYHLHIKGKLEEAVSTKQYEKFHFILLRNLYEKTSNFLGYKNWPKLLDSLPMDRREPLRRLITSRSHNTLSGDEASPPTPAEKKAIKELLRNLDKYGYFSESKGN